jgi:iron complex transport system ATP-binding protein
MLRCVDLKLGVPGRTLVQGASFHVEPGQVWAVLGRNGTGKSTLIHALGGLAAPEGGRVELDGHPVAEVSSRARAQAMGVLLQLEEGIYWGSAEDYVLLGRFPHSGGWTGYSSDDVACARAALEAVGMSSYAGRRYASLSGGERQRVRIAQALAQAPRLFLLDEPLQHLDLGHQAHVLALFTARARDNNQAAVMVMHEPLWIGRGCTHALVFDGDGGVEAGPAAQMLTRERLERAYGCSLREIAHGESPCFVPDV